VGIQSVLRTYQTRLVIPTFLKSYEFAECVIAPATEMRGVALQALASGAGSWAQELEARSRAQIAQGYRSIGTAIAQGYVNFFSALMTDTVRVDTGVRLPFLQTVREEVFAQYPGIAAAAVAGRVVNRGTTYINKLAALVDGVGQAFSYWNANRGNACGQARLFGALGMELVQHTPDLGGTSVTEGYSYALDGMTDDEYRQYVREAVRQLGR